MSSHIILSKSPHTDLLHDFLTTSVLKYSLFFLSPTSLLQPHSLLTVWQHQSHLTSELLPSTWVFFPREPHDLSPIFWVIAQMLASQWGHPWPRHIKKHLSTPSPRYSKVTSSRKSSLISLFPHLPQSGKIFLPSKSLYLTFLVIYWFYLVLHLLGPSCSHYTLGSEGKELCLLPFCFL